MTFGFIIMDIFVKKNNKFFKHEHNYRDYEIDIEKFLEVHPYVLDDKIEIIGRQVIVKSCGTIDLMGFDSKNNLVIIEIKKNKAKYNAIGQIINYHTWARNCDISDFIKIKDKSKLKIPQRLFNEMKKKLDGKSVIFNENPRLYIVAEHIPEKIRLSAENLLENNYDIECVEIKFHDNNKIVTVNKMFYKPIIPSEDIILKSDKLFNMVKKYATNLNDVVWFQSKNKKYNSFKHNNHNFLALHVRMHKLIGHIVMKNINDPQKLTRPHAVKKHRGRVHEMIIDESNIKYFKCLIKQAYKNTY